MKKIVPTYNKIVITISYGSYVNGKGGTDKVIKAHQDLFNENDISVIHLYKARSIGEKVKIHNPNIWGVLADGQECGLYSTRGIIEAISLLEKKDIYLSGIFIHHLNYISIEQLSFLLKKLNHCFYFYLHDYYTICPSTGLITEQGEFCGEEKPNDEKCKGCTSFTNSTTERLREIENFFDEFKKYIKFVAPSEVAKDIWIKTYPQYKDNVLVVYHQKLVGKYKRNKEFISGDYPLKVAFVGYQRPLKGWDIWFEAVTKIYENVNYCFFQFGTVSTHVDYIKEIDVDFTKDLDAMIKALRDNSIDVAVLWSLWPETYSYTLYEAMAANAFILTNSKSGNIAYQVDKIGNGIVANNIFDLKEILANEKELRNNVNSFKTKMEAGPLELKENDTLLSLVDFDSRTTCEVAARQFYEELLVCCYNGLLRLYKRIKQKRNVH